MQDKDKSSTMGENPSVNYHTFLYLLSHTAPRARYPSLESISEGKYLGLTGPQGEGKEGKSPALNSAQETIFLSPALLYSLFRTSAKTTDTDIDWLRGKPHPCSNSQC